MVIVGWFKSGLYGIGGIGVGVGIVEFIVKVISLDSAAKFVKPWSAVAFK